MANIPPQDIEAEKDVLGSLLVWDPAADRVFLDEGLKPEDFYLDRHQLLAAEIQRMIAENKPIDELTVVDSLTRGDRLDAAGGRAYIGELAATVAAAGNAGYYASIVVETSRLRHLLNIGHDLVAQVMSREGTPAELQAKFEGALSQFATTTTTKQLRHISDALDAEVLAAENSFKGILPEPGVPTGLVDVDKHLGGFQGGDLIVLAARPAMGKSTLAAQVALHAAEATGTPVAVFSVEMSEKKLARRLISAKAGVPSRKWTQEKIEEGDLRKVVDAAREIDRFPFYLHDIDNITLSSIRSESRRLKSRKGLSLIVIDYLQILGTDDLVNPERREREIGAITVGLKVLAGELDVPILLLSQLNRAVESRPDKRPMLSDLRESGSIEQDADIVLSLFREGKYDPDCDDPSLTELAIMKARDGDDSRVFDLGFERETTQFVARDWLHR